MTKVSRLEVALASLLDQRPTSADGTGRIPGLQGGLGANIRNAGPEDQQEWVEMQKELERTRLENVRLRKMIKGEGADALEKGTGDTEEVKSNEVKQVEEDGEADQSVQGGPNVEASPLDRILSTRVPKFFSSCDVNSDVVLSHWQIDGDNNTTSMSMPNSSPRGLELLGDDQPTTIMTSTSATTDSTTTHPIVRGMSPMPERPRSARLSLTTTNTVSSGEILVVSFAYHICLPNTFLNVCVVQNIVTLRADSVAQ